MNREMQLSQLASYDEIETDYAEIRTAGQRMFSSGVPVPEPIPQKGGRWGVSAVFRPGPALVQAVAEVSGIIRPLVGAGHAWYDASSLHSTVRSIEDFRGPVAVDDEMVRLYERCLRQAVAGVAEISVLYQGVMASASGVLLQGWPCDRTLQTVRERFHAALQPHFAPDHREQQRLRRTAHASVAVFTDTTFADCPALADYMSRHHKQRFSVEVYRSIELVSYDLSPGVVTVNWLASVPLGQG